MNINVQGFLGTFPIVIQGMAGIFIVIGVIFVTIKILMKFSGNKIKDNNEA